MPRPPAGRVEVGEDAGDGGVGVGGTEGVAEEEYRPGEAAVELDEEGEDAQGEDARDERGIFLMLGGA